MAHQTIKMIKGTGPGLSTDQLEDASMKLLLARVRGEEPQVSFNFIQRVLDELILRRHEDVKLDVEIKQLLSESLVVPSDGWLEGSDDLEDQDTLDPEALVSENEWLSSESFDLTTMEYTDLEPAVNRGHDDRDTEEELTVMDSSPPQSYRPPVLACSRLNHRAVWRGSVNPWRVLVISLLVVLTMACGVIFMGCNHHDRAYATTPDAVDSVDGVYFTYLDLDKKPVELDLKRRGNILSAAVIMLDAFKQDYGVVPGVWRVDIFVGPTVEENPGYVPCGIVNGGGCVQLDSRLVMIIAGECDNIPYLYHELNHVRLHDAGVDRILNYGHSHPSWVDVGNREYNLRKAICAEREAHADHEGH